MVYEIIPTKLARISSPYIPNQQPFVPFFFQAAQKWFPRKPAKKSSPPTHHVRATVWLLPHALALGEVRSENDSGRAIRVENFTKKTPLMGNESTKK